MNAKLIANIIKELAKGKNIPVQQALAECGVKNKGLIYDLESRDITLSASTASKIANYFEVSLDYLLGTEKIKAYDQDNNPVIIDQETINILNQIRDNPESKLLFSVTKDVTPEDLIQALKVVEALKGNKQYHGEK